MTLWRWEVRTVPQIVAYSAGVLVLTVGLMVLSSTLGNRAVPQPQGGVLDLRAWDFRSGTVPLGGFWSFLEDQQVHSGDPSAPWVLRHVPDTRFAKHGGYFAGTGSGTYRLLVLLPPQTPSLAIRYGTIWTSFEIDTNGAPVAHGTAVDSGTVVLPAPGSQLEIIVRVTNHDFRWGGIVHPLVLGDSELVNRQKRGDDLLGIFLVGALVGVSLYSVFLFFFRRRDLVNLSFALFALMVALRALTSQDNLISELFPGLSVGLFLRIEYLALYGMLPAAALFFWRLFPEDFGTIQLRVVVVPSVGFLLMIPFTPLGPLSWTPLIYSVVALALVGYGYFAWSLRPAFRHRQGALLVHTAGTMLLGTVVYSMSQLVVASTEVFFPLAITVFVFVQSLVMARRFTGAFETVELLAGELKDANRRLGEEAREAEEARDGLAEVVAEKEVLLREVHHRVKNSLQIVLSIINLKVRRSDDPGALGAYASVRDRIRAIAEVHNRLFGFESEKRVDLPAYLRDLIRSFTESYADAGAEFRFESDPLEVSMEVCLDLGLIVTELVLNSYRHAVMPRARGVIEVSVGRDSGRLVLRVADDGPGFPEGFHAEAATTLGFKIVQSLVNHRAGKVSVVPGPGAQVEVEIVE